MMINIFKQLSLALIAIFFAMVGFNCKQNSNGVSNRSVGSQPIFCGFSEKRGDYFSVQFFPGVPNAKNPCEVESSQDAEKFFKEKLSGVLEIYSKHGECKEDYASFKKQISSDILPDAMDMYKKKENQNFQS